jgi:two-component sensor histidine kinase
LSIQHEALQCEKEWLMKEIHHRVKNNLQIVISLLSTQSNYIDNDIAYNAIRESQHRMQSISLIHQKLYQSENLARVDIRSYIAELVTYLRESFETDPRISFELDIVPIDLDVTRAVPLGLILNEAITNAIKYAFPDERIGKISICIKEDEDKTFLLRIHDDGIGSPVISDIQSRKSLGMSLMHGLSKQLSGSFSVKNDEGIDHYS